MRKALTVSFAALVLTAFKADASSTVVAPGRKVIPMLTCRDYDGALMALAFLVQKNYDAYISWTDPSVIEGTGCIDLEVTAEPGKASPVTVEELKFNYTEPGNEYELWRARGGNGEEVFTVLKK